VLEAYKIPTGSMQPTLMGNEETGIFDRVIVDKLSYHFRDPERFEIAVFKYPLDSSKNYIKRIVGMPGERLRIENGDLFVTPNGETEERVLRRSRAIQDAQLKRLDTEDEWGLRGAASKSWTVEHRASGDRIVAVTGDAGGVPRPATATYPGRTYSSITDDYLDGYPEGIKDKVIDDRKSSNMYPVPDLRLRASVQADAECTQVAVVLHEGGRRYRFVLPGPAAPADQVAHIEAVGLDPALGPNQTYAAPEEPLRLIAGEEIDLEVQNLNDLLSMRVNGEELCQLEIPPGPRRPESRVTLEVDAPVGKGAVLDEVRLWRDIHYTVQPPQQRREWLIPEGHYLVLGDNTQDSSDARDWTFAQFQLEGGEVVRGSRRGGPQVRPDSNPYPVGAVLRPDYWVFHDDLGERHVLEPDSSKRLPDTDEMASFVPRDLIRGRAVVVVWPFAFWHDVYRLKWVR
ncbi:MAG: signal peptidase I, partial [Planctomycetota bacterium]|nr:signal peptidase I [Planctomycetota bacterium]